MTDTDTARRPHLLLISTGERLFRQYLLSSIATRYRVHLFLAAQPDWENRYIDAATVLADTLDAEAMIAAARELHQRDPLDGVLCWDEARILATSRIAQALGLPGGDPDVVLGCRDKHLTRQRLAAAGVAQPRSVVVDTLDQALAAADDIGYPVVLKPRGIAASLGVVLAADEAELREHFRFARETFVPGALFYDDLAVLVEEYADGPEISIDSAVHPRHGVPDVPGPQGTRLPAVLRGGRPPGRRGRADAVRSAAGDRPAAGARGARLHRRDHPYRVPAHPVRAQADRGQRPARRRPDPVPGDARHRHRPGPGRGGGGLRPAAGGQSPTARCSVPCGSATCRTR